MNREIKFRAWDKTMDRMLLDADPFAIHVSGSNEPLLATTSDNKDCIFEQYTGLRDKHGKEIYEGDILKTPGGQCICQWSEESGGWVYQFKAHRTDWFDIVKDFHEESEVIGNIHEDPGLLEDENE